MGFMTIDINSVHRRLEFILDYLNEIKPLASISLDEFLHNRYLLRAAERLLEITIQAAIDINNHLLKELSQTSKQSNADVFLKLSRLGVITPELAQLLSESGKFRNRLAHRYDDVDPEIVFSVINEVLEQYPLYVEQVENFMDSLEENDNAES
jgi:uncharacterized protein YutE (UPF0331/DUF86 family)